MDASTHTAFALERQRAADLARDRALVASHREHRAAREARETAGALAPAPRRVFAWFRSPAPAPAAVCDPACLALAGPSA
jgi:hypothetical protein